jgi:hypothetical protein
MRADEAERTMGGTTSLIPASRFGQVLNDARVRADRSIEELAHASQGQFTALDLRAIEDGHEELTERRLARVAELYGVAVDELRPARSQLVIDLDSGTVAAGERAARFEPPADEPDELTPEVLTQYLSLVYAMRDIEPGTPIPLRDLDIEVLCQALDQGALDIERELRALMADAAPLARRTRSLRRRLVVPAAGVLVAATAIGTLVFVQRQDATPPDPTPAVTPSATTDVFEPVPVAPGEVSVEVPPIVYERDDPSDPPGEPRVIE